MISWISNYFEIKQKSAQFVFWSTLLALLSIFLIRAVEASYTTKINQIQLTAYTPTEQNLAEFQKANYASFSTKESFKTKSEIKFQRFNPNTASKDLLMQNGIPERVADRILKSRNGGFVYRSKESFSKTYGMSEEMFANLEPYIEIPQEAYTKETKQDFKVTEEKTAFTKKNVQPFDINTATPEQLQQIKGIGPSYAKRILNYRDALGGFYDVHQVLNVYKLPDSIYTKVAPFLYIKQGVKKINVNNAEAENIPWQLLKSNKKAAIIAYRDQHGPYKDINDLRKVKIISEEDIKTLEPYIAF